MLIEEMGAYGPIFLRLAACKNHLSSPARKYIFTYLFITFFQINQNIKVFKPQVAHFLLEIIIVDYVYM